MEEINASDKGSLRMVQILFTNYNASEILIHFGTKNNMIFQQSIVYSHKDIHNNELVISMCLGMPVLEHVSLFLLPCSLYGLINLASV